MSYPEKLARIEQALREMQEEYQEYKRPPCGQHPAALVGWALEMVATWEAWLVSDIQQAEDMCAGLDSLAKALGLP